MNKKIDTILLFLFSIALAFLLSAVLTSFSCSVQAQEGAGGAGGSEEWGPTDDPLEGLEEESDRHCETVCRINPVGDTVCETVCYDE